MKKSENLEKIALAGSAAAGLAGCRDELTSMSVKTSQTAGVSSTKTLYEGAILTGAAFGLLALIGYRIFRKYL